MIGITTVISGWYLVNRYVSSLDNQGVIVGNYKSLTNFVENSPHTLLVFDPIAVLKHPYNDPFSDVERRAYLWEYFYRSAFTGEFSFGKVRLPLVISMLFCGFFAGAWVMWRVIRDMIKRNKADMPMWAGFIFLLLTQLLFRWKFPYSSSQDFRYSIALLIPFSFYLAQIVNRRTWPAHILKIMTFVMIVCAITFEMSIVLAIG